MLSGSSPDEPPDSVATTWERLMSSDGERDDVPPSQFSAGFVSRTYSVSAEDLQSYWPRGRCLTRMNVVFKP
jgi:hypothetical protein